MRATCWCLDVDVNCCHVIVLPTCGRLALRSSRVRTLPSRVRRITAQGRADLVELVADFAVNAAVHDADEVLERARRLRAVRQGYSRIRHRAAEGCGSCLVEVVQVVAVRLELALHLRA